jgi:hypothetical protein
MALPPRNPKKPAKAVLTQGLRPGMDGSDSAYILPLFRISHIAPFLSPGNLPTISRLLYHQNFLDLGEMVKK